MMPALMLCFPVHVYAHPHALMNPATTNTQVKLLYILELAYYAQELPMLFIWFTKRKDFGQLVAHHIATLGLIIYSLELG